VTDELRKFNRNNRGSNDRGSVSHCGRIADDASRGNSSSARATPRRGSRGMSGERAQRVISLRYLTRAIMRRDKVGITWRDVAIIIGRAFNVVNYTTFRRRQNGLPRDREAVSAARRNPWEPIISRGNLAPRCWRPRKTLGCESPPGSG
jgi:uncharacterized protein (DUF3084 family)